MYGALLECSVVVPQSLYRNVALFYFLVGVVGGVGAAGPPPMPVHATKFGVWRAVALGVFFYLSIFLSCCILYPPPCKGVEFGGQQHWVFFTYQCFYVFVFCICVYATKFGVWRAVLAAAEALE